MELKSFKGIVANPGIYTGKIKLVTSVKDIGKVKEGDIVVTVDNSPLFSLAFMKASAIISERGGSLCHLAIVSREMDKPCILGVESASLNLKEGMLVKVDATNNKITILENE
jgi:pyruvate,water dikinase